jgi:hypothetical protein
VDKQIKFNRILIDLDSLLDVRQGVLSRLLQDDKALADYVASEAYNFREMDDFSAVVNMQRYKTLYTNPTKDIVSNSTITYLFTVLKKKILDIEKRNVSHNETKALEILVNTYPFKLSEEEQSSLIDVFFIKLKTEVYLRTIYIPPEQISPTFIRDNDIIELYIYDTHAWLNVQLDNVHKASFKLHGHRLNFPALYTAKPADDFKEKLTKHGFKDVFSALEYLTSAYMVVNFLPVIFYSNIITSKAMLDNFNSKNASRSIKELFEDQEVPSGDISKPV